jgi:hypothetical protein
MLKTQYLQYATHKKETDMNRIADVKTGAKLLQNRILVSLISGLIALVGIVGFAAAKKVTGI